MANPGFGVGRPPCSAPPDTYGWPALPKLGVGSCYQHGRISDKAVPAYNNVTLVNDFLCPPGGVVSGSGCCDGSCTPDPLYNPNGITPYVRFVNANDICSGGSDFCTPTPGGRWCGPWRVFSAPRTAPYGDKPCLLGDTAVDFNCFHATGGTVDLSVCRKFGFKNRQAWKAWHGTFGYLSHNNASSQIDLMRSVGFGTLSYNPATCAVSSNTITTICNGHDIEYEQTSFETTKYLEEDATITYSSTDNDGAHTATLHRNCAVGRYNGILTRSCTDSGDARAQSAAHFWLFKQPVSCTFCDSCGCSPFTGMPRGKGYASFVMCQVVAYVVAHLDGGSCGFGAACYNVTIAKSGTTITFTSTDGNSLSPTYGLNFYTCSIDTSNGSLDLKIYGYANDGVTWQVNFHETVSMTMTGVTHTVHNEGPSSFGWNVEDFTITTALITQYTSANVESDYVGLHGQWKFDDDLLYPWRHDVFCGVAPVLHYSEPFIASVPSVGDCYTDWPTNTTPWVDPNTGLYDGTLRGQPVGIHGLTRGFFNWDFKTYRACCDGFGNIGLQIYAYGAFSGESNASLSNDVSALVPKAATEWTQNITDASGPGLCALPPVCADNWFGLELSPAPVSGLFTTFPCSWSPGSLPPGPFKLFSPTNQVLYGQEWCETKIPRPSINFARPCGCDAVAVDETTVRCIQAGSTLGTITINSATAINTNDLCWICGGGFAAGIYKVTKLTATTYSAVSQPNTTGCTYAGSCDTGILGKLRFPTATACTGTCNDDQGKGEYAYCQWTSNMRDFQERKRVTDQYTACASCADAAPASSTQIRYNQWTYHSMPQCVATFSADQHCLPFTVCDPQVLIVSSAGESFVNQDLNVPPTFTLDGRYGNMWQGAFVQSIPDPFWQVPHKTCVQCSGPVNQPTVCNWVQDDGSCLTDTCSDDCTGSGNRFYAHPPMVENRLTIPAGCTSILVDSATCPGSPGSGMYIGYLTLACLDTVSAVNGNILLPPQGQGYPADFPSNPFPLQNDTPWGLFIKEVGCVCSHGTWAGQYAANGASVTCPP